MKDVWTRYAKRIDALSLRERVILFVSVAVVMAALADTLVLSPQSVEQKALATKMRKQVTELDALRAQLAANHGTATNTPQGRLQQLRAERLAVDEQIRQQLGGDSAGLPELLEKVLRRHERLTVLRLATAAPRPAAEADDAAPPQLGVDLSLTGSYLDLVAYLAEIERTLPGVRWSELQITSTEPSAVLKVRVYLLTDAGART